MTSEYFPSRWIADFQYWWAAGAAWLEGWSPYAADHIAWAQEWFPTFTDPFFYPPSAVPLLAPIAALDPHIGAQLLAILGLVSIIGSSVLLACASGDDRHAWWRFSFLVLFLGVLFHPTTVILTFSGLHLILLSGLSLWIYGVRRGVRSVEVLGLVLLCVKPIYGGPLLLWCCLQPERRGAASSAAGICVGLFLLGTGGRPILAEAEAWMANAAQYGTLAINDPTASAGLGFLAGLLDLRLGLVPLALLLLATVLAAWSLRVIDPVLVAVRLMLSTLFLWNGHGTDFVFALPALVLVLERGALAPRLLLAVALLALGQAMQIAALVDPMAQFRQSASNAAVATVALTMAMLAYGAVVRASARTEGQTPMPYADALLSAFQFRMPAQLASIRRRGWAGPGRQRRPQGSSAP
ncbi:MAG: glycosyltransferase 87 family protein [Pseudomonadota bacterium]